MPVGRIAGARTIAILAPFASRRSLLLDFGWFGSPSSTTDSTQFREKQRDRPHSLPRPVLAMLAGVRLLGEYDSRAHRLFATERYRLDPARDGNQRPHEIV